MLNAAAIPLRDDAPESSNLQPDPSGFTIQYDPRGQRTVVRVGAQASTAQLTLSASRTVRVHAGEALAVEAQRGAVRIKAGETAVAIEPAHVALRARELSVEGETAHVVVTQARAAFDTLSVQAERVRTVAEVIQTEAGRVAQTARRVFREVEGALNVRAKTAETFAVTTLVFRAARATLLGRRGIKVNAARVDLGG